MILLAEELLSAERDDDELEDGTVLTLDELRLVIAVLDELRLLVTALDDAAEFIMP